MTGKALAVLGLALILVACGSAKRERPRSTEAAFLAAANRICAEATTRTGRLARLRALRPPLAAADLYSRWLRAEKDALRAAAPGDETSTTRLDPDVALAIADGKISGYARRLGAKACAKRAAGTIPP